MILVTSGTQLPFPRLMRAMNNIAAESAEKIVVQTGQFDASLRHVEQHTALDPLAFDRLAQNARLIIAHAGIGSILDAARFHKPLIIVPRRHDLGEHRNDHQLATARRLIGRFRGVTVAWTVDELAELIAAPLEAASRIGELQSQLASFLACEIANPSARPKSFLACLLGRDDPVKQTELPARRKSANSPPRG